MSIPSDLPPSPLAGRIDVRPAPAFLLAHPAHLLALGFGCGLSPIAPGTVATLWAWASFALLQVVLPPTALALLVLGAVPLAWWSGTVTARSLGRADPSPVVIDEIASFWLVLWVFTPAPVIDQFGAFCLFRLFDALKPGPVGWADRHFHGPGWRGGFGILFDDLVAAGCTLLVLAFWRFFA